MKHFVEKAISLWEEYKDAWKRAWEACNQSSETWHDNFEFDDANRVMQTTSKRLREVQDIINNAQVVPVVINNHIVNIWKKIRICINWWNEQEYVIWGYHTPIEWRVWYSAPLIQGIIWKTEWDVIEILLHWKKQEVEILEVSVWVNVAK